MRRMGELNAGGLLGRTEGYKTFKEYSVLSAQDFFYSLDLAGSISSFVVLCFQCAVYCLGISTVGYLPPGICILSSP